MQENTYTNKYNKVGKKLLKILIIFLVILFVLVAIIYIYNLNKNDNDYKEKFAQYFYENDLKFFCENETVENLIEKIQNSSYNLSSNVKLDSTMENNMFSDLNLSNFNFKINYINNYNNSKKINFNTKYSGNDLLNFDFIINKNQCAIKFEEIDSKYLGCERKNVQQIINGNSVEEEKIDLSDFSEIIDFIEDRENYKISEFTKLSSLKKIKKIIDNSFDNGEYSSRKNIFIKQNNENKEVVEYEFKLSNTQFNKILEELYDNIDENNELIEFFVSDNQSTADEKTLLNYDSNEGVVIIPAEESNQYISEIVSFQNSIENSIDNNIRNSIKNEISNNVNIINNVNNVITNTAETITENVIINNSVVNVGENISQNEEEHVEIVTQPETVTETVEIVEEENLRTKGFFSINEDSDVDYVVDDSEFVIGENYDETIQNIKIMSGKINWKTYLLTGSKTNLSKYEFAEKIKEILNKKIRENSSLNVKIYVYDGKTIKYIFEMPEINEEIAIEFIQNSNTDMYLNISILEGENSEVNGRNISIYKKEATAKKTYTINVNKITKGNISKKTKINFEVTGTAKDMENNILFNLSYTDANGVFKIETDNTIKFDDVSIEILNDENCIFLDQMSDEDLFSTNENLNEKLKYILSEKNRDLNIINLNSLKNIIKHENEKNVVTESKDEIRQVLIQSISQKMQESIDAGREFELSDLENMQIDGYSVQISINSNVAVINVNGYIFNLDNEFNLSDV